MPSTHLSSATRYRAPCVSTLSEICEKVQFEGRFCIQMLLLTLVLSLLFRDAFDDAVRHVMGTNGRVNDGRCKLLKESESQTQLGWEKNGKIGARKCKNRGRGE